MWWAALLGGLINIAGTLAGRVLIGLGISVITYTGLSSSLGWLKSSAVAAFSGLPAQVVGMLSLMKVGSCISMVVSAILVKAALDGLASDTMKRWTK
jgi:hypothetical protein